MEVFNFNEIYFVNFQEQTKNINLVRKDIDIEQIKIDYNNVSNLLSDLNDVYDT